MRDVRSRLLVAALAAIAGAGGLRVAASSEGGADNSPLTVRITSPMGRTGIQGPVRIVAQVGDAADTPLQSLKFFVNRTLVGENHRGPVYAVEWSDDNPFEATEISVEATDSAGRTARDAVRLDPFEIVDTTRVLSVLLEATVQDAQGRFVPGLHADGFTLEENGLRQTLDVVRPEMLPATYALLVDSSQSMARSVDFLREAAGRLAFHLRPRDRVLVVPFSQTLGAVTGPTADRATIADAIAQIAPRGGTAILDALPVAARLVSATEGRHVIILVTDGYDENSSTTVEDAIARVQSSGSTVYVIGVAGTAGISIKGQRLLKAIAAATGGRAFFPSRDEELPEVHDRLVSDVSNQYLITYTPTDQKIDGTWRAISLATGNPAYKVRTKPGYFAPKPPPVHPIVEFTITDAARRQVSISRDDLTVVEDGVDQQIETFTEATSPVSIIVALDESGSMRKAADAVKAAAASFVEALRPEDKLAVMRFSDRIVLDRDPTTARRDSLKTIEAFAPHGGTALYDAIHAAMLRLKSIDGRRVVVVLTDGRDEDNAGTGPGSVTTFEELLQTLRETQTTVFTIALGSKVDRACLERIATESGGNSYVPETVEALPAEYARIIEDLRRRYVVSYLSTNGARDGAWRVVDIRPSQPGLIVRSSHGYFAPDR
jgi:Ca-activated chloride channel family protein